MTSTFVQNWFGISTRIQLCNVIVFFSNICTETNRLFQVELYTKGQFEDDIYKVWSLDLPACLGRVVLVLLLDLAQGRLHVLVVLCLHCGGVAGENTGENTCLPHFFVNISGPFSLKMLPHFNCTNHI